MNKLYPQAARHIQEWIVRERLLPSAPLPSALKLAKQFGYNPTTTLRACQALIAEGVLVRDGYKLKVRSANPVGLTVDGSIYVVSYLESFTRAARRILTLRRVSHRVVQLSWGRHLEPVLRKIFAEKPAGLLLWTPEIDENAKRLLMREGPTFICAGGPAGLEHSYIQSEHFRAVQIAIQHLHKLGHRHIAHVHAPFADKYSDRELAEAYQLACRKLDLPESALTVWQTENTADDGVRHTLKSMRQGHPEVTALFCVDRIALLALELFDVPREISVVGMDGMPEGMESRPPLTTLALRDPDIVALLGCADLIAQIEILQAGRPAKPPAKIFLVPDLILRESTRALIPQPAARSIVDMPPRKKIDPAETWRKIYPFLAENRSPNWSHLDLSALANHSITRHHGWLGAEPLEHFPPGLRSMHGVPFQVLDGGRNEGRAVITFRSPHARSTRDMELPTTAKLKLKSWAKALYFLHGCGHARFVSFAEYTMHYKNGSSSQVPLVPLGLSPRLGREQLGDLQPNLQDWWPDAGFERQDFPHAQYLTIYNPAEPGSYERYLYTLEWINPKPDDEIKFIEVRVDPEAGPTLALIAVTALLAED